MEENKNTEKTNTGQSSGGATTQTAKDINSPEQNKPFNTQQNSSMTQTSPGSGEVTDSVKGLYDKAKESGGQVLNQAKEKASSAIGEQKTNLASGLGTVAESIRQVGDSLREGDEKAGIVGVTAKYGDTLAQQIERFSGYLERSEVKDMVRDVESFARRNPALFIGAAFAAGFLAVRFLRSAVPRQNTEKQVGNRSGNRNSMGINTEAPAF